MTHVAIHDALNAIDRRSRPYAFTARVERGASPEAAVAAAAHDVMVPLLNQIPAPFPPACGTAGVASVEADYAAALNAIPDGRAKTRGIEVGKAAAAAILALRAADGSDTPLIDPSYPQGTRPGEYRFTPGTPFAFAPGWADVTPFVLEQFPVPSGSALRGDVEEVHGRLRRDQAPRRGRHHHAKRAHRRADRDRSLLGRELPAAVESNCPDRLRLRTTRSVGAGPTVRPAQHGSRRRLRRLLRHQVPLELLVPGNGNPDRRYRRQPEHQRGPRLDATGDDSSHSGLRLSAQRPRRSGSQVLRRFFGTDHISFKTCSLTLPPGSTCNDLSPVLRRYKQLFRSSRAETDSRASSSGSTSARRSTKGSSTEARSATVPSTASCGSHTDPSSSWPARPRLAGPRSFYRHVQRHPYRSLRYSSRRFVSSAGRLSVM